MRYITLAGVRVILLLFVYISTATSQQNSSPLMKILPIETWKEQTILLVQPGSTATPTMPCQTREVSALRNVYETVPKRKLAGIGDKFSILVVQDPFKKQKVFVEGEHNFYISQKSGLTGMTIGPGVLVWSESYYTVPESESTNTAIEEFQRKFDVQEVETAWKQRGTVNGISFGQALPRFYLSDAPIPGTGVVLPKIEGVDLTDNVLRLDIRNPVRNIPATIWIDLQNKKPIKSIVDGKEMDLSAVGTNRTYAIPLNSN